MDDDRPVTPPDYVCESCGHHVVDAYELRETAEVDHMLENRVMENASPAPASADMASPETVGLAAGGAKRRGQLPGERRERVYATAGGDQRRGPILRLPLQDGHADRIGRPVRTRYAASVSDHPNFGKAERVPVGRTGFDALGRRVRAAATGPRGRPRRLRVDGQPL